MKKSWESYNKVIWKLWESHEKSWENPEKVKERKKGMRKS